MTTYPVTVDEEVYEFTVESAKSEEGFKGYQLRTSINGAEHTVGVQLTESLEYSHQDIMNSVTDNLKDEIRNVLEEQKSMTETLEELDDEIERAVKEDLANKE